MKLNYFKVLFLWLGAISLSFTVYAQQFKRPGVLKTECSIHSSFSETALESYCKKYGAIFTASNSEPRCIDPKSSNSRAMCYFMDKSNSAVWQSSPDVSETFYESPKGRLQFLNHYVSTLKQDAQNDLRKLIKFVHPFNELLAETPSGEILIKYFKIKHNGVGLSVDNKTYYDFLVQNEPFKSVSHHYPDSFYAEEFWETVAFAFNSYKQSAALNNENNTAFEQLEKYLQPIYAYLKQDFNEQAFLFFPIDSEVSSTFSDIRLMLYYEKSFLGKIWGRSIIIPFQTKQNAPLIVSASYDLESARPQSFLYEELFEDKSKTRNRQKSYFLFNKESCMQCHFEINKPKIGKAKVRLTENSAFFSDYKDAYLLSNPYANNMKGSEKLEQFYFKGTTHFFPKYLQANNGTTLKLYSDKDLGPTLGNPNDAPHSFACFKDTIADSRQAYFSNCYYCHNNQKPNLGAINGINFEKTMIAFDKQLRQTYDEPSSFYETLYNAQYMPFDIGLAQNAPSKNQSEIISLKKCLKSAFPKDILEWQEKLLRKAFNEIQ